MNIHLNKLKQDLATLNVRMDIAAKNKQTNYYQHMKIEREDLKQRIETLEGIGVPPEGKRDTWTSGI